MINTPKKKYYRHEYVRWIILSASVLASILASIQSSALIVALTNLIVGLNATLLTIIWVLMAYFMAITVSVVFAGPLADTFGKGKVYCAGYTVFTIASMCCALSQPKYNGVDLVIYRIFQGIGAGMLFSTSTAIVVDRFIVYNQVGLTQGIMAVAFAVGSAIGPLVGGGLVKIGWNWIFWINVPFGAIGTIISYVFIRDSFKKNREVNPKFSKKKLAKKFDWPGLFFFAVSVCLVMLFIIAIIFQSGAISSTTSLVVIGCIAVACIVTTIVLVVKIESPFLDFKNFGKRNFTIPIISSLFGSFARGNINFGSIFYFQGILLADHFMAGVYLIPFGIGTLIGGPPSGLLADVIGSKLLVILGPLLAGIGMIPFCMVKADWDYWYIATALFVGGMGWGIFNSPNSRTLMLSVERKDYTISSSLSLMVTMIAQTFSIVAAFTVTLNTLSYDQLLQIFVYGNGSFVKENPSVAAKFVDGINLLFYMTVAASAVAFILGFFVINVKLPKAPTGPPPKKPSEEKLNSQPQESVEDESTQGDKDEDEKKELSVSSDEESKRSDDKSGSDQSSE